MFLSREDANMLFPQKVKDVLHSKLKTKDATGNYHYTL